MNNLKIGEKYSFWDLIKGSKTNNILIPVIQRDYTYGSETEDTDKVLNNLLCNIKSALLNPDAEELTMNFVYGYTEKEKSFVPLDGQQRLTTLFLLYYYAALFSDITTIDILYRFTYATRETTRSYCHELIEHYIEIKAHLEETKSLRSAIHDMAWYLPSFDHDPSIRSMQVVLERIESTFKDVKEVLWNKLATDDCRINFYLLDFGPFGLSDDLYVKMNSRGKKLTEYEIFKSMLLKHIEKKLGDKGKKRHLAIEFDNKWTDLVWNTIGKPTDENELSNIDDAYVNLMKLIVRIVSYKHGKLLENIKLDRETIESCICDIEDVEFIEDFLNTFSWAMEVYQSINKAIDTLFANIILIKKETYSFKNCLLGKKVTNGDLLYLIGSYYGLRQIKQDVNSLERIQLNIRHLRNIIENSDNEIRENKMPLLVKEVEDILSGGLKVKDDIAFNTNQWLEECDKESNSELWKELWKYEEHELLRGSLSLFSPNDEHSVVSISDQSVVLSRLDKFMYIFDDKFKEHDVIIRAGLLTMGDYTQYLGKSENYRIIGNIPLCWRNMFVRNDMRHNQEQIIDIIDAINVSNVTSMQYLENLINNWIGDKTSDTTDWRYYAIKYREYNYVAYTHNEGYGYYYIDGSKANTLECAILQSSGFGETNVAWYLLNYILFQRNSSKYAMGLERHAANDDEARIFIQSNDYPNIQIDISINGWKILGLPSSVAEDLGIKNIEVQRTENEQNEYIIAKPDINCDYIEWAELNILQPIGKLTGFSKVNK